jgi:hypothetical protein
MKARRWQKQNVASKQENEAGSVAETTVRSCATWQKENADPVHSALEANFSHLDSGSKMSDEPNATLVQVWDSKMKTGYTCEDGMAHALNMPDDPSAQCHSSQMKTGHMPEPGKAHFPVMSQKELASIMLPVSTPANTIRAVLAEQGVCLLTGVLSEAECMHFEKLWQDDLGSILQTKRAGDDEQKVMVKCFHQNGIRAWPEEWSSALGKKGSVSQRGLPHGAFAWNARLHPGVRQIFADLFETSPAELAVGLDCIFWSSASSAAAETNPEWLHADQNHRTGVTWPCFQGVLYIWSSEDERASTTVVWPGSHKDVYTQIMHDKTALKKGKHTGGQSVRLSQLSNPVLREQLTGEGVAASRRVPCPAGSLLLWDSRTIHQGWCGGPRLAQPVCWEPRQRRDQDQNALRRKVFMCAAGVPSSHSSAEARVHGMAPRSRPCELWAPAICSQIVPYCIAANGSKRWESAQSSLWGNGGDPRRNADEADIQALAALLKPEVLAAL